MKTHRDIIDMWPSRAELARDIGDKPLNVRAWWQRDSIPGHADVALVSAAERRGFDVTFEKLAQIRATAVGNNIDPAPEVAAE